MDSFWSEDSALMAYSPIYDAFDTQSVPAPLPFFEPATQAYSPPLNGQIGLLTPPIQHAAQPTAPKKVDPRVKPVVVYPTPLPKGRRAKTAEEKQQRADERIQRNRRSAAKSREKHGEFIENLKRQLQEKDEEIAQLKRALEQAQAQAQIQIPVQQRALDLPDLDTSLPPSVPADFDFGESAVDALLAGFVTDPFGAASADQPPSTTVDPRHLSLH